MPRAVKDVQGVVGHKAFAADALVVQKGCPTLSTAAQGAVVWVSSNFAAAAPPPPDASNPSQLPRRMKNVNAVLRVWLGGRQHAGTPADATVVLSLAEAETVRRLFIQRGPASLSGVALELSLASSGRTLARLPQEAFRPAPALSSKCCSLGCVVSHALILLLCCACSTRWKRRTASTVPLLGQCMLVRRQLADGPAGCTARHQDQAACGIL